MSQTLWGKQKGPFAAPPEWSKQRSPWAYIPIWLLLPLTIMVIAFSSPPLTAFYACSATETCAGTALPGIEDGTYKGIAVYAGTLMLVGLVLGVLAAIRLKKWPVWLCWSMAAIGLVLAVIAFLALIGSMPTPFGEIIPRRISSG